MENNKKNYMVVLNENDYPNKNGISTLIGIYPTMQEASFIKKTAKERNKLEIDPEIVETNFPATTTKVGEYLSRLAESRVRQ